MECMKHLLPLEQCALCNGNHPTPKPRLSVEQIAEKQRQAIIAGTGYWSDDSIKRRAAGRWVLCTTCDREDHPAEARMCATCQARDFEVLNGEAFGWAQDERSTFEEAEALDHAARVHSSTWQGLYRDEPPLNAPVRSA